MLAASATIIMRDLCKSAKHPKSGARDCLQGAQIIRLESRKLSKGVSDLSASEKEEDLLLYAVKLSISPAIGHSTLSSSVGFDGISDKSQYGSAFGHAGIKSLDDFCSVPHSLVTHDFSSDSHGEDDVAHPIDVEWRHETYSEQYEQPTATSSSSWEQNRVLIDFGASFVAHARLAMLYCARNIDQDDGQLKVSESETIGCIPSYTGAIIEDVDSSQLEQSRIHEDSNRRCCRRDLQKAEAAACTAMNIYRLVFSVKKEKLSKDKNLLGQTENDVACSMSHLPREREDTGKTDIAVNVEEKNSLCETVGSTPNLIALSDLWRGRFFTDNENNDIGSSTGRKSEDFGSSTGRKSEDVCGEMSGQEVTKNDDACFNRSHDATMNSLKDGKYSYSRSEMFEVRSCMLDGGTLQCSSSSASKTNEKQIQTHAKDLTDVERQQFNGLQLNPLYIDGTGLFCVDAEEYSVLCPAHDDSDSPCPSSRVGVTGCTSSNSVCGEEGNIGIQRKVPDSADDVRNKGDASGPIESKSSSVHNTGANSHSQVEWRRREWEKEDRGNHTMSEKGCSGEGVVAAAAVGPQSSSVSDAPSVPIRKGNKKDRRNALRREKFGSPQTQSQTQSQILDLQP